MPEFILNPRRSPRAPVRCRVQIITGQGNVDAETEDVGMRGCQLISPRLMRRSEPVRLVISHPRLREPLEAAGRVAWASPQEPWRLGIAFDEGSQKFARRWYEKLVETVPGIPTLDRIPEKIAADASLFLGTPPKFVVDFSPDEAIVLRSLGSGARIDELKAKLNDRWVPCQRAIFSLLARHHVTLARGHAVHPEAWKKILAEIEASYAIAGLSATEQPTPAPVLTMPRRTTGLDMPSPPRTTPAPAAATALSSAGGRRSTEAQACLERGLAEMAAGNSNTAMALLRRAAQLAPGDPEVQDAFSRANFRDRNPNRR